MLIGKTKEKGKRGELTSKQLITIIILIVSFAIILIFFFALNLKSEISKESCRNSIILKSSIPIFKDVVKLKCRTEEVCISASEDCKGAGSRAVKVKVKNEEEVYKELADLMRDCWWMMGEGKIEFVGFFGGTSCAICSVVYFDEKVQDMEIDYNGLYNYLQNNKVPGKDFSYLFYLTGFNRFEDYKAYYEQKTRRSFPSKIDLSKPQMIINYIEVSWGLNQDVNPGINLKEFNANNIKTFRCSDFATLT